MRQFGTIDWSDNSLLVVDDDQDMLDAIEAHLKPMGFRLRLHKDPNQALADFSAAPADLVLSDLKMPEMDGIHLVEKIKEKNLRTPVLLMTAHGSEKSAIEALHQGAFDYIHKPLHFDELQFLIKRALRICHLEEDYERLQQQLTSDAYFPEIIGNSAHIRDLKETIRKVAKTDAAVLIQGESGSGKELVARAIHSASPYHPCPFVALNCSAIPKEILESEMFGHMKGAFSGAICNRDGVFQSANGGTLFLDEIGDMPLDLQSKLLRVLQEKTVRPVGSDKEINVEVRIVSASHQDLKRQIIEGTFREDLYFRLSVFPLFVPPLRERKDDIPLLLEWFLRRRKNKNPLISQKALTQLLSYSWPGNIRELQNVAKRAEVLAGDNKILEKHIILEFENMGSTKSTGENPFQSFPTLIDLEKSYIGFVLNQNKGHKDKTAQILGIDRKTLYRKQKQFRLEDK